MALVGNYVGRLNEMAQVSRWKAPEYFEVDPPRGGFGFAAECRVLELKTVGISDTKKKAKQEAARIMIEDITNTGVQLPQQPHEKRDSAAHCA